MASDLLLSERMSDVILKVRHEDLSWRMPAHSLMLVNKSSIFQQMLDERTEEAKPIHISIVGVKPDTAVSVLNYLYDNTYPENVTGDLLIAANTYDLPDLRNHLEERLINDMTVTQACEVLEELNQRQPMDGDCIVKAACKNLIEMHALTVLGSDLVFLLGKRTLVNILGSDCLNVPDEAFVFWAMWRWGRRQCSKSGRSLRNDSVQMYIDDMIVLIRRCSIRCKEGIPSIAFDRFDKCKPRRSTYICPPDILKHSRFIRPCPAFEELVPAKASEESIVCLQLSVEKDVMLVGVFLEMSYNEGLNSFVRVIREADCVELRRQRICWCQSSVRKLHLTADPEYRLEAEVTFQEPLFLTRGHIYSIHLSGNFSTFHFLWGPLKNKRMRVGNSFIDLHGEGVTSVRDVYFIPDVSATWGPRGPTY